MRYDFLILDVPIIWQEQKMLFDFDSLIESWKLGDDSNMLVMGKQNTKLCIGGMI